MKERETVVAALRDQKCFHLWAGKMVQKKRKKRNQLRWESHNDFVIYIISPRDQ